MKRNLFTLFTGLLLLLIFVLLLFVFQVRESEVVVVTTFGKPTRHITSAGPYVKAPWPIQRVYRFDQRVQNFSDRLTEGLTRDNLNLLTSVFVGWRITEPTVFFKKFAGSPNPISEAEKYLDQRLGNVKAGVIGRHPLSDLVSTTDNGTNFLAIETEMLDAIRAQVSANTNWGLEITFLGLKKVQLPESVSKDVLERMQNERKRLAERAQSEGEAESQTIHARADSQAAQLLSDADSQATQIKAEGEAKAADSLAIFKQNSELANFIFRLNALEYSLKDRSILIFDQHTPPFDLLRGVSTNLLNGTR